MISSANRRLGFTQVQGPRSVKPLLLLDVLYGGGDYSGGSGEIDQVRDVAGDIGCHRRPLSQPLYIRLGLKESV